MSCKYKEQKRSENIELAIGVIKNPCAIKNIVILKVRNRCVICQDICE